MFWSVGLGDMGSGSYFISGLEVHHSMLSWVLKFLSLFCHYSDVFSFYM
jgi:hypothetical protein